MRTRRHFLSKGRGRRPVPLWSSRIALLSSPILSRSPISNPSPCTPLNVSCFSKYHYGILHLQMQSKINATLAQTQAAVHPNTADTVQAPFHPCTLPLSSRRCLAFRSDEAAIANNAGSTSTGAFLPPSLSPATPCLVDLCRATLSLSIARQGPGRGKRRTVFRVYPLPLATTFSSGREALLRRMAYATEINTWTVHISPFQRVEEFDCPIIMVIVTRAQTRTKCYEIAMNTPMRTAVRILNTRTLLQYSESCTLKRDIGTAVIELEVAFDESTPLSLPTLRRCLRLMPNITDLILQLPSCSPRVILNGLRFPSLQLLESNLPHRVMAPFIEQHPTIKYLLLGPCEGGRQCPLHTTPLDDVADLRLPLGCLSDLSTPSAGRLHTFLTDQILSSSTVLRTLRPYSSLYSLTIEFRNDDYDILCGISGLAPTLRKLRLLVRPSFQVRSSVGFRIPPPDYL
ncbi:hypothetical protein NM688_g2225 [Phlebia brevispora]|uniref:Uncharacterized protein n=1 Tax=Phlebia brevispora TaxID=194682 RepID=A0ACC1T9J7_9APHY|nr:hypothetical protein NM688_g2225 [Phlebia brevispora]